LSAPTNLKHAQWGQSGISHPNGDRHESGQIESITNFNDKGELHGKALQYFQNGKIKRETTFDKEKK